MAAFFSTFLVILLAEIGDKTQLLVMAFAMRYLWREVFAGMVLGILVVHSLAVAVGSLAGSLLDARVMAAIASVLFLAFGVWTLRGGDEEDEEAHDSRFGPVLTVALAFLVGEMGDKTQFAAMTMAATQGAWIPVLVGAVAGMVLADSLGIIAGRLLHRRLPAEKLRLVSAGCFFLFGIMGLVHTFLM